MITGSSGDRRRTGVIEDIDDDEFFLRQRGVSQDNAEISQYISSAIRKDFNEKSNRQYPGYTYDGYDNNNTEHTDEYRFDERPRKPLRHHGDGFNRSFESYDDYHNRHEVSDNELPVATQYFPRHDDENLSFYDNEYVDDMDQPNIMSRDHRYDSDIDNEAFQHRSNIKPEVPKRRRKGSRTPAQQDSIETNEEVFLLKFYCSMLNLFFFSYVLLFNRYSFTVANNHFQYQMKQSTLISLTNLTERIVRCHRNLTLLTIESPWKGMMVLHWIDIHQATVDTLLISRNRMGNTFLASFQFVEVD